MLGGCDDLVPDQQMVDTGRLMPVFEDVAHDSGIGFRYFVGATGQRYMPEIVGGGVALFDYDGDDDLDVYFVQGTRIADGRLQFPAPDRPGNRLYRNEGSDSLRFSDVTEAAGVGHDGYGMGVAVGDIDNDGDSDLYLTNFGSNALFENLGDGTFRNITTQTATGDPSWSTSAAFLDYDRDGDLDLFVTNYINFTLSNHKACTNPLGQPDYCDPNVYMGVPDRLYRNEGNGRFVDVSERAGLNAAFGSGLGVVCAEFNQDGWTDIFVANDMQPNQLWMNLGEGRFENVGMTSGTALNLQGETEASMGVTAGDFDGDGDEDLFMTHLRRQTNTLYVNDGLGNFVDATDRYGLGMASRAYTGFGAEWFDYDNNGTLDVFIANGAVGFEQVVSGNDPYPYKQTNQLFQNDGQGNFTDISAASGPAMSLREVSRGAAFGDIDNDGDVDIVVANNNGPTRLLLNQVGNRRHWLVIKLEGVESNRDGMGVRVAVLREGIPPLWRRAHTDGSYASANDIRVHFGLGDSPILGGIVVVWPSGQSEIWSGITADRFVTLREGDGDPWSELRTDAENIPR